MLPALPSAAIALVQLTTNSQPQLGPQLLSGKAAAGAVIFPGALHGKAFLIP